MVSHRFFFVNVCEPHRRRRSSPPALVSPPMRSSLSPPLPNDVSLRITVENSPKTTIVASLLLFPHRRTSLWVKTYGITIAYTTGKGMAEHYPQNRHRCRAPPPASSAKSSGGNHRGIAPHLAHFSPLPIAPHGVVAFIVVYSAPKTSSLSLSCNLSPSLSFVSSLSLTVSRLPSPYSQPLPLPTLLSLRRWK